MEKFINLNYKENNEHIKYNNNDQNILYGQKILKDNIYISDLEIKSIKRKHDYLEEDFNEIDKKHDDFNFKQKFWKK